MYGELLPACANVPTKLAGLVLWLLRGVFVAFVNKSPDVVDASITS
jgi:hypothetical protein